jgi:hypothetical protein
VVVFGAFISVCPNLFCSKLLTVSLPRRGRQLGEQLDEQVVESEFNQLKPKKVIISAKSHFEKRMTITSQEDQLYNGLGNLDRYNGLTTPTLSYEKTIYS